MPRKKQARVRYDVHFTLRREVPEEQIAWEKLSKLIESGQASDYLRSLVVRDLAAKPKIPQGQNIRPTAAKVPRNGANGHDAEPNSLDYDVIQEEA